MSRGQVRTLLYDILLFVVVVRDSIGQDFQREWLEVLPNFPKKRDDLGRTELRLIHPSELERLRERFRSQGVDAISPAAFDALEHERSPIVKGDLYAVGGNRPYLIYNDKPLKQRRCVFSFHCF